jgi:transcriptional regulator with XRE-family HTH domain
MEIKPIIGQRIKQLREKNGISQKDLAFESNLDRSYIASVENGQRNISIVNITKIASALKVSLKEFFNDEVFNHTAGSPE